MISMARSAVASPLDWESTPHDTCSRYAEPRSPTTI